MQVTGKWRPRQINIAALVNEVILLRRKFTNFHQSLVEKKDIKFAFKLARESIVSQVTQPTENSRRKYLTETCVIYFEDTDRHQMLLVNGCMHRYCYSCMRRHVEMKLLHGLLPNCPHDGCKSKLELENCKLFLTPKLFDIMKKQVKEASVPVAEKIYCPYPRCSALMSKTEVQGFNRDAVGRAGYLGARMCTKCCGIFCINCKVPWHHNMSCSDYKRLNPYPCPEDAKLKSLATRKLWRRCVKCKYMVELAEGCYHIYCRCGHEFCYTCGAEWKNKRATCNCPLGAERNIIYGQPNWSQR